MASLRLQIGETAIYEGPPIAAPRVGEGIHRDGEVVPVEALVCGTTKRTGTSSSRSS